MWFFQFRNEKRAKLKTFLIKVIADYEMWKRDDSLMNIDDHPYTEWENYVMLQQSQPPTHITFSKPE